MPPAAASGDREDPHGEDIGDKSRFSISSRASTAIIPVISIPENGQIAAKIAINPFRECPCCVCQRIEADEQIAAEVSAFQERNRPKSYEDQTVSLSLDLLSRCTGSDGLTDRHGARVKNSVHCAGHQLVHGVRHVISGDDGRAHLSGDGTSRRGSR